MKEEFEKDILAVLKKYGYKIELIQQAFIHIEIGSVPGLEIKYLENGIVNTE